MISTENISVNSNLPKKILPGNNVVKINSVSLNQPPFAKEDNGYRLTIEVETKPIDGFEGFARDKNDPSKGNYLGQIGWVDTWEFYYKDGVTKNGTKTNRDNQLLIDLVRIMTATDCEKWRKDNDKKFDTIEEYVAAFNHDAPFKDKWINICVCGKRYKNKSGYDDFNLFLPRDTRGKFAMTPENEKSKCIVFNETEHIKGAPATAQPTQANVEIFDEKPIDDKFTDDDWPFKD